MAMTRAEALAAVALRYPDTTPTKPILSNLPHFTPEQLAASLPAAPAAQEPPPILYGQVSGRAVRPDLPSAPTQLTLFAELNTTGAPHAITH